MPQQTPASTTAGPPRPEGRPHAAVSLPRRYGAPSATQPQPHVWALRHCPAVTRVLRLGIPWLLADRESKRRTCLLYFPSTWQPKASAPKGQHCRTGRAVYCSVPSWAGCFQQSLLQAGGRGHCTTVCPPLIVSCSRQLKRMAVLVSLLVHTITYDLIKSRCLAELSAQHRNSCPMHRLHHKKRVAFHSQCQLSTSPCSTGPFGCPGSLEPRAEARCAPGKMRHRSAPGAAKPSTPRETF